MDISGWFLRLLSYEYILFLISYMMDSRTGVVVLKSPHGMTMFELYIPETC